MDTLHSHSMILKFLQHFTLILVLKALILISRMKAEPQVVGSLRPRCSDRCGNITIPYPFGIEDGCYLRNAYKVNCTTLTLHGRSFKLVDISVHGSMHVTFPVSYSCYNTTQKVSLSESTIRLGSKFSVSSSNNILTSVGCDTRASVTTILEYDVLTSGTTTSECSNVPDASCSGYGCREVPLPPRMARSFHIVSERRNKAKVGKWEFNNCSYAFIVKKRAYTFHKTDFDNLFNRSFPVFLEWTVGDQDCKHSQKNKTSYLCKENSVCIDSSNTKKGYNCKCDQGYQGNPYLTNGCQDINECERVPNDCIHGCVNTNGSYNCFCPSGMSGDGRKHGSRCYLEASKSNRKSLYTGIISGAVGSVMLTFILYSGLKQRRTRKNKEMFFIKNGGLVLQKILFESKNSSHVAKIIAASVLEKATNNFHQTNVIGKGGFGTVYKGVLEDKTMVAIKKSKSIDDNQIEQFINEVIMLSEITHPNIVKLLGCCLETPTPLLVYEFVTNKTVFHHLHEKDHACSMTLERRLNIAIQTAEAIAHMHSTTQIIHRDIKSSNILLTDDYTAKVSDFGISRFIPMDQTHVHTLVHGTLGYIDPEYFRSGNLTERSDVYSFGMVLVELLTGRKVYSHDGTESDLGLAMFFVSSVERGCLIEILDNQVGKDGIDECINYLAKLAKDCIELEGKKRPNIMMVKEELEQLRQSFKNISFNKP